MNKQLELFPEKIKKTKSVITRQSNSNHFREWNDVMASIAKNFSVSDRKYFAGMVDGDGSFTLHTRKDRLNPTLRLGLELRHDHAEPVTKLAELFDLTIRRTTRLDSENTQDTLKIELSGIKVRLFLFSIYPYLLEKKDQARDILIKLDCPKKHLPKKKNFSFEYLDSPSYSVGNAIIYKFQVKTTISGGGTLVIGGSSGTGDYNGRSVPTFLTVKEVAA